MKRDEDIWKKPTTLSRSRISAGGFSSQEDLKQTPSLFHSYFTWPGSNNRHYWTLIFDEQAAGAIQHQEEKWNQGATWSNSEGECNLAIYF